MILNRDNYNSAVRDAGYAPAILARFENNTAFGFYFTGSRCMGGARPDSDWDFMVTDSPVVRRWLRDNGFESRWDQREPESSEEYMEATDEVTRDVFERTLGGHVVQVQLCDDAERKFRTAVVIREQHFERHLTMTSAERSALWREVYATV